MRYIRRGRGWNKSGPSSNQAVVLSLKSAPLGSNLFMQDFTVALCKLILKLFWYCYCLIFPRAATPSRSNHRGFVSCNTIYYTSSAEFMMASKPKDRKVCFLIDKPYALLLGGSTMNSGDLQTIDRSLPAGLQNSGNTCFLAAATQLLITIPSIRRLVQVFISEEGNSFFIILD